MITADLQLKHAVAAVARAAQAARTVQSRLHEVQQMTKDDRSPVTVADFAVQAMVAMDLTAAFGPTPIVGEESADALRGPDASAVREAVVAAVAAHHPGVTTDQVLTAIDACGHDGTADTYWTLDPVDGTKGFLRGQQYAIALGQIEGGQVVRGVMACPNLPADPGAAVDVADGRGMVFAATVGGGCVCWHGDRTTEPGEPVAAGEVTDDRLVVCSSVEAAHSNQSDSGRIIEHLGLVPEPLRLDSQCKYAVVARGQADAYLRMPTRRAYVEKIWDHAAGSLIAIEAGAVVTDITGAALDFSHGPLLAANRGVVCAAPGVHGRIIEAIRELQLAAQN